MIILKNKYLIAIGNACFPVLVYLILAECFTYLLFQTKVFKSDTDLRLQNIVVVLSFLPLVFFYWNEIKLTIQISMKKRENRKIRFLFLYGAMLVFGIAWNNLVLSIPFAQNSVAYQQVNETLLGNHSLVLILLRTCVLAPIVEEMIYRNFVYQKLKVVYGVKLSILFSSVLFGAVHMNMVQFIYATGIGLFFAYIYEKEQNILYPILFHATLNIIAVFREETKYFLPWEQAKFYQISSLFLAVIAAIIILYMYKVKFKE